MIKWRDFSGTKHRRYLGFRRPAGSNELFHLELIDDEWPFRDSANDLDVTGHITLHGGDARRIGSHILFQGRDRRPKIAAQHQQGRFLAVGNDQPDQQQENHQIPGPARADPLCKPGRFDAGKDNADADAQGEDQIELGISADAMTEPLQDACHQAGADMKRRELRSFRFARAEGPPEADKKRQRGPLQMTDVPNDM